MQKNTTISPSVSEQISAVEIRHHPRSRRLKLSYRKGRGFLLTHPPRASRREIQQFLESQQQWMQEVAVQRETAHPQTSLRDYLQEHPRLYLNGIEKQVRFSATSGLINVTSEAVLIYPGITESQLVRKLQQLAKQPLTDHLLQLAEQFGIKVASIHIRDQRSRWGSCSGRKNISLNWRLLLMPHELQRHICLHELAHIPHPNHSKQFWNCLHTWDPNTPIHREILRKSGTQWIELGRNPNR